MQELKTMDRPIKPEERRKYQRIPKQVKVETNKLTYPIQQDEFSTGKSKNISQGGVLLTLPEEYEAGSLLQLKLTLFGWRKDHPGFIKVDENSIGSPFTAIGEVVWARKINNEYETAIKFVNIDKDDYCALRKYLEK